MGVALLFAEASFASPTGGPPIIAPADIGLYAPQSANKLVHSDPVGKKILKHVKLVNDHSTHDVSAAYGGAPALVES